MQRQEHILKKQRITGAKKRKGHKPSKDLVRKRTLSLTKYKIYCEVNGKTYETQGDCSEDLNISKNTIWSYLNGTRTNKFHLQKVNK